MPRKARIKVRFNLAKGPNYFKWKVVYPDGTTSYFHPTSVQLVMDKCELRNNQKVAEKIYNGAHKEVCAWVLCEEIKIFTYNFNQSDVKGTRLRYNPRVTPNWDLNGMNMDGMRFNRIESVDYGLYLIH